MFRLPIVSRIGRQLARFAGAEQGNIAMIFAIALVPVLGFVGAAVDYSRAVQARTSMQAALDSTALMLSKDLSSGTITTSQISAKATAYFNALFTDTSALPNVTVTASYTASTSMGSTIQVNGDGNFTTTFMKIVGFPTLDISTSSTSAWGLVRMRVAMVLDNTGSMADNGKISAMQTAAKNLVDQLSALAKTDGDVYISIVPFAKDVNVGASNYSQSWMDFSDWDAANGSCSKSSYTSQSSCVSNGKTWTAANHNTWTGCVVDREQDYDTKNTTPTNGNSSTLFPAEQYSYCNTASSAYLQPIMPLSYDWTSLKSRIDAMKPTGNTNQGIGLAWGWMTLSTGDPMNAPAKDTNYTYKDAIVLLSDGLNTQNRWYSNASQIDARQKKLCDNAKAANITIYTVQVNTGSDPTSSVLQYCASSTDKFYLVTLASQTVSVFKDIGTSLSKLRVAR
ncbi:vWA domain-containing protein [Bradyrhizobium commune]|uniref:Pilus assembly protein TadG n=1 Tax=Bradyrhizobium commune TaxID=83627 RepID=A0A7S9H2A6_9BRAD|nr:pilus assembly protein [Bradyrhizobium commune]QPF94589.1 pilus assembly protein TadG [Bradyrhizobium commune]